MVKEPKRSDPLLLSVRPVSTSDFGHGNMFLEYRRKHVAVGVPFPFPLFVVKRHGLFHRRTVFGRHQAQVVVGLFVGSPIHLDADHTPA